VSADASASSLRPFNRSLPMALLRAREAVMREFRPLLAEHGITEQQWRVLRSLADAEQALDMGELGRSTLLLGPSLSRMVARMEQRHLVSRSVDGHDARRWAVSITEHGRELIARIGPASEDRYAAIESRLGPEALAQLEGLLGALASIDHPLREGGLRVEQS